MSEWVDSTVGAVTAYQRAGGTPTATTDSYYGGDIPFVTIEDITNGTRFLDRTEKNLSESGLANSAAWLIKDPHVLYSMYATVGKPVINRIACATNQAIIALKESSEIEQSFLFYQLLFMRPSVFKYTAQTTQSNLNACSVKRLPISYPMDKRKQRKIAAILTATDTAIEKTEVLIAKYQQIKAGLMHDPFTRGVLPNGQLRPPRSEAPELYQETAIGWIPREWGFTQIDNLCSEIVDCPHSTPEYLKAGDIIYSREGERLGIASPVAKELVCLGQRVMLLRPAEVTSAQFLMWSMNMPFCYRQVIKGLGTTTSPHVNVGDIKRIFVSKPSPKEQEQVGLLVANAHKKISVEQIYREKLRQQKLGLMQGLLTGKVPVKVGANKTAMDCKEFA